MTAKTTLGTTPDPEPIVTCKLCLPCGGNLLLGSWRNRLVVADWVDGWHHESIMKRLIGYTHASLVQGKTPVIENAVSWLEAYFAGSRKAPDIALQFFGTEFQLRIWHALEHIAYGKTITYGELAAEVGCPRGSRAAGVAVGQNPFSIIVPCHRVIGKDGALTGYGGGYDAKKFLLALESGISVDSLDTKNSVQSDASVSVLL